VVSFTTWQLYPWGKNLGTHWIGDWVDPRAGLDAVEKRNILPMLGVKPRFFSLYPVAITTELSL
jgi:hypothetical protein